MISRRRFLHGVSAASALSLGVPVRADGETSGAPATAAEARGTGPVSRYVRLRIGTGGHGHTFPGATVPFGMVQLSPDTFNDGWDWSSGYHYSDGSLMGFS